MPFLTLPGNGLAYYRKAWKDIQQGNEAKLLSKKENHLSAVLFLTSKRLVYLLVPAKRLELPTSRLRSDCSTN